MSQFTINITVTAMSAAELLVDLQSIVSGLNNGPALSVIQQQLHSIEDKLMTQDDSLKALKDANDALKASTDAAFAEEDAALDNIKADINGLVAKLATLGELTPANQAIVDDAVAGAVALAGKVQARADALKAASDIYEAPQP